MHHALPKGVPRLHCGKGPRALAPNQRDRGGACPGITIHASCLMQNWHADSVSSIKSHSPCGRSLRKPSARIYPHHHHHHHHHRSFISITSGRSDRRSTTRMCSLHRPPSLAAVALSGLRIGAIFSSSALSAPSSCSFSSLVRRPCSPGSPSASSEASRKFTISQRPRRARSIFARSPHQRSCRRPSRSCRTFRPPIRTCA
jgi:hypothetical protein